MQLKSMASDSLRFSPSLPDILQLFPCQFSGFPLTVDRYRIEFIERWRHEQIAKMEFTFIPTQRTVRRDVGRWKRIVLRYRTWKN